MSCLQASEYISRTTFLIQFGQSSKFSNKIFSQGFYNPYKLNVYIKAPSSKNSAAIQNYFTDIKGAQEICSISDPIHRGSLLNLLPAHRSDDPYSIRIPRRQRAASTKVSHESFEELTGDRSFCSRPPSSFPSTFSILLLLLLFVLFLLWWPLLSASASMRNLPFPRTFLFSYNVRRFIAHSRPGYEQVSRGGS